MGRRKLPSVHYGVERVTHLGRLSRESEQRERCRNICDIEHNAAACGEGSGRLTGADVKEARPSSAVISFLTELAGCQEGGRFSYCTLT